MLVALCLLLRAHSYEKESASGFGFRATERATPRLEKLTLGTLSIGPFSTREQLLSSGRSVDLLVEGGAGTAGWIGHVHMISYQKPIPPRSVLSPRPTQPVRTYLSPWCSSNQLGVSNQLEGSFSALCHFWNEISLKVERYCEREKRRARGGQEKREGREKVEDRKTSGEGGNGGGGGERGGKSRRRG